MKSNKGVLVVGLLVAAIGVVYLFVWSEGKGKGGLFAPSASLVAPAKVTVDEVGNVYIADLNNSTIDKLTTDGKLTIVAGEPGNAGLGTGKGSQARFVNPSGIAIGPEGSFVVADEVNNVIYRVTPDGMVTILAGTRWSPTLADTKNRLETGKASAREFADGAGVQARFNAPKGVAVDSSGNTYVADSGNGVIRKITPAGEVTTVAGSPGERGDKDGKGYAARFFVPQGVAVDAAGNLYVADTGNHTIRKITSDGIVSTLAGKAGEIGRTDGKSDAAKFYALRDIAIDPAGNLYVIDSGNYNVRKITPQGNVSTVAGEASSIPQLVVNLPTGITVDHAGNLYVADMGLARVTRISASGEVTVLAGSTTKMK